jgi:hypothetical protein
LDQNADISRHDYWRQLRDMKGSAEVDSTAPVALNFYAGICAWTREAARLRRRIRSRNDRRLPLPRRCCQKYPLT